MHEASDDPEIALPLTRPLEAAAGRRHAQWAELLATLSALVRRIDTRPREGTPAFVRLLPTALRGTAHAALLAWLCDPLGEHHLGPRALRTVLRLAGVAPPHADAPWTARVEGELLCLAGPAGALRLALRFADDPVVYDASVRGIDAEALGRELAVWSSEVAPETQGLVAGWAASLRPATAHRNTMATFQSFGPDARFVLEHWHDLQALSAARARLDAEFVAMRQWVFAQVESRWRPEAGWACVLEEDWILLRRTTWPVPVEEWLALVVVISDVESVLGGGPAGEGWFAALSLPTDGEFDDEAFTALLRGRLDAASWRAHLSPRWPGYAVGRMLPAPSPGEDLAAYVAATTLAELEALTALVPHVDAVLGSLR